MTRLSMILVFALLATLALPGAAAAKSKQKSPMHDFATGDPISGTKGTLEREDDSVELDIKTWVTGGNAYTIWWIIFNNPDACSDPCGMDDLGNPEVIASALWATGKVAKHNGRLKVEAELDVGEFPGQVLFGPGLLDAEEAEVHAIVRSHGPASSDPDILYAQLHTVDGACDINTCVDEQGVGFVPLD